MAFAQDEKALAMITAYRALVVALIKTGSLDPNHFEEQCMHAVAWLERIGETGASSAAAEFLEPLTSDIRRLTHPGGGA